MVTLALENILRSYAHAPNNRCTAAALIGKSSSVFFTFAEDSWRKKPYLLKTEFSEVKWLLSEVHLEIRSVSRHS